MKYSYYVADPTQELTVNGLGNTLRALNRGQVRRLMLSANHTPGRGWQCRDCLALYAEAGTRPEVCLYCASAEIKTVDLRTAIIARAFELGCAIEMVSRSQSPEREISVLLGGISS